MEGFFRRMRKDLAGVVQGVSFKRGFLVRFQYGCEKDITSNQLDVVTVYRRSTTKEAEVPKIYVIPDETVNLEKG